MAEVLIRVFKAVFFNIFDTANLKTFTSSAVATGVVTISVVDTKLSKAKEDATIEMQREVEKVKTYVDYRHETSMIKLDYMIESQKDLKREIKTINNRVFKIKDLIESDW